MTGQFIRKPVPSIIIFVSGLSLIGLSVYTIIVKGFSPVEHCILLGLGSLLAISNLFVLISMQTAFLYVENQRLNLRHLCFVSLNCPLNDVAFVFPQMNSLLILLKTGKRYNIMGISNSYEMARYIHKQTFSLETESPDILRAQLAKLTAKRKRLIPLVCGGIIMIAAVICVAAALTGGRDISDFTANDFSVMAVTVVVWLLMITWSCWLSVMAGKLLCPIEHTKFRLRSALIASQPLPPGNVRYVYTDPNFFGRLSVRHIPSAPDMYFIVERMTKDHLLFVHYESELFPDEESLYAALPGIEEEIDITYHFI